MKVLIGALTVLILMIGAPSAMAFQAYWTPEWMTQLKNIGQGLAAISFIYRGDISLVHRQIY